MSNETFLGTAWQDTKYDKLAKLRWLQVTELKHKYPNDADLGEAVRELVNNTK